MFGGVYAGRTVLVTGHTGFKGAWLSLWLTRLGARVVGYSLAPPTTPSLYDLAEVGERIVHVHGDVRDADAMRAALDAHRPEIVFHLAASALVRSSYDSPLETFATNVMGTLTLLDAIRRSGSACAVVAVSTDKCYENREWEYAYRESDALGGHDPYSASKGAMEIGLAAMRRSYFDAPGATARVRIASARAGNVIGGGDWSVDRLVPDLVRAIGRGDVLRIRSPGAVRPWQHVLEPLSGYLTLGARLFEDDDPSLASAWNFGPSAHSHARVDELLAIAVRAWGEGRWEVAGADSARHEASLLRLACDKAYAHLAWRPVWELSISVERTVSWYRQYLARPDDGRALRAACESDLERYERDASRLGLAWTR